MALNSVNTNIGAMVALQSLNRTNEEMAGVQKRISTGLRVSDARDDGAAFAVAERVRGDMAATTSANQQLGGVKGLLDVGRSGLENVSESLKSLKETVLKLGGNDLTAAQRTQYQTALKETVSQIRNFLADSDYNGQTILTNGTAAGVQTQIKTIRNGDGDIYQFSTVNVKANIITHLSALVAGGTAAGSILGNTSTAIASAVAALTATGRVSKAINGALDGLNAIGGYSNYVDRQVTFNKTRMDAQETGLGALIDADLAKESAKLQALQIRQQLGTQSLSIANQAPQALMRLFQCSDARWAGRRPPRFPALHGRASHRPPALQAAGPDETKPCSRPHCPRALPPTAATSRHARWRRSSSPWWRAACANRARRRSRRAAAPMRVGCGPACWTSSPTLPTSCLPPCAARWPRLHLPCSASATPPSPTTTSWRR